MPKLRARKSAYDDRVTLVSFADSDPASSADNAVESTSTDSAPGSSTRKRSAAVVKKEEASYTEALLSTPSRSKRVRTVKDESDDGEDLKSPRKSSIKASVKARPPTPTKLRAKLETPHPEPPRWRETYEIIRKQRENIVAAVDTMGCDAIAGSDGFGHPVSAKDRRLASLISLLLSSQTKDPVTHEATMNLRRNITGGLSLQGLLEATDAEIHACINKVGFWRRKTVYIRKTAEMLRDKFDGDVPKTIEDMLLLPGIGPKMGFLCLQAAWGIQSGIGVDTHVHRITNRLGWHRKPTTEAEETRVNLESWLPAELHRHINVMLVGLGQTICLPINPRCDQCHLGLMEDSPCPSKRKALFKQAKLGSGDGEPAVKVEIGAVADSAAQVAATDSKAVKDIKLETMLAPGQAQQAAMAGSNASPYFNAASAVNQEDTLTSW